jgi:hypothetical protein
MEWSVQPFVIRSEQDLWRAVHNLGDGFAPGTHFAGWPIMRIRSSLPINGVSSAFAVMKLQDSVNRLFCLMRYGTRSIRRMTSLDKERVKLGVYHLDGNCGLDIDFTNAANACVAAVVGWGEHGPYDRPRQRSMFAVPERGKPADKESWERTVREIGVPLARKAPPRDVKCIAISAIFAFALAVTSCVWIKVTSDNALKEVQAGHEFQIRMAELDRTIVKSEGATRPATPKEVSKVESDLKEETRRVMALASDEIEQPLLRFVMKEIEGAIPPLMEMAPQLATYNVNGAELHGKTAAVVGKSMLCTAARWTS